MSQLGYRPNLTSATQKYSLTENERSMRGSLDSPVEVFIQSGRSQTKVLATSKQYGSSIQKNVLPRSTLGRHGTAEVTDVQTIHPGSKTVRPASASQGKSRVVETRQKTTRPRTPTTYLSRRAPSSNPSSPRTTQQSPSSRSIKRKPSIINDYVTGQLVTPNSELCAPGMSNSMRATAFLSYPKASLEAAALQDRTSLYRNSSMHSDNYTANISAASQLRSSRPLIASPALSNDMSVSSLPHYRDSPLSHATTLSSRTSYSPMHASTSQSDVATWSGASPSGSRIPRELFNETKASQLPKVAPISMDSSEGTIYSPRSQSNKGVAASTHPLTQKSLIRGEQQLNATRGKAYGQDENDAAGPQSAVVDLPRINTAPPELAHLMIDSHDGARNEPDHSVSDKLSMHSHLDPEILISKKTARTFSKLQDFFGETLPTDACSNVFEQRTVPGPSPLTGLSASHRASVEYRLTPSIARTSATVTARMPVRSPESKQEKPRSSLGFWRRERVSLESTRSPEDGLLSHRTITAPSKGFSRIPTIDSKHDVAANSNDSKHQRKGNPHMTFRPNKAGVSPSIDEFLANRLEPLYLSSTGDDQSGLNGIITSRTSRDRTINGLSTAAHLNLPSPSSSPMEQTPLTPPADFNSATKPRNEPHQVSSPPQSSVPQLPKQRKPNELPSAVKRPTWSIFSKQKRTKPDSDPPKGFFKRALASTKASENSTTMLSPPTKTAQAHIPSLQHGTDTVVRNAAAAATDSSNERIQRTPRGRAVVYEPSIQLANTSQIQGSSNQADAAPRRSSSIIRNSLDAISRGRLFNQRNSTSRPSRISLEMQRSADARARPVQPTGSAQCNSSSVANSPPQHSPEAVTKMVAHDDTSNMNTTTHLASPGSAPPYIPSNSEQALLTDDHSAGRDHPESNHHLSQVVEEEFLAFSATRNSTSSHGSSSATYYFPVAPSRPPTISLPKLPDELNREASLARSNPAASAKAPSASRHSHSKQSGAAVLNKPMHAGKSRSGSIGNGATIPKSAANNHRLEVASHPRQSLLPTPAQSGTVLQRSQTTGLLSNRWKATTKALDADVVSMTDLRFASLMTSKWLSFGRVLFSPVHSDLKVAGQDRILVIDGLGSDWSYYCALTYPNVSVHMLALSSLTHDTLNMSGLQAPPNFRKDLRPDSCSAFPHANNSFAAVIIRFPRATSDTAMRLMVAECTRVLRPGGYLEISAIDLDLANMGSRARKSVRELKMRLHVANQEICLKPISDNMQTLLGRCGYEKLSRCIIGVPAAGPVAGSRRTSAEESIRTFDDLVKDDSEGSDKGIVNMVSKVGRWWYNQCYEELDRAQSIWDDKLLLGECEELRTAFKLLVCYAQKPTLPSRKASSL